MGTKIKHNLAAKSRTAIGGRVERPKAVLFMTGFGVLGRNSNYITHVVERGMAVLLITPMSFRPEGANAYQHGEHVVHHIRDIAFVRGMLSSPESFTADVIAVVKAWESKYIFAGVCAIGEVLVEQAGLVADRYGLKGPGLRASRVCRSKYLQRWYLPQFAPRYQVIPPAARADAPLDELDYPVIVKPASRHSSSGVTEVVSAQACRERVRSYPEHETLLVEERVKGAEFSVEALVQDGSVVFISATSKRTTEDSIGGFTEISHCLPYRGDHESVLVEATCDLLTRLDFRDGIAHAEWRIREPDGKAILMEVAARTPGDALMSLYGLVTGASIEEAVLQICLGEPAVYPAPRRVARQVYVEHPAGAVLRDVVHNGQERPVWVAERGGQWPALDVSSDAEADGRLKAILVLVARGTTLPPIVSSDDRAVTFIIDGPDEKALDALEANVSLALHLVCDQAPGPRTEAT